MREAIEFHIQGLKEDKLPIPEPTTTAKCVEVVV
jgi:predicted RNase H-like HicB family nuclease